MFRIRNSEKATSLFLTFKGATTMPTRLTKGNCYPLNVSLKVKRMEESEILMDLDVNQYWY